MTRVGPRIIVLLSVLCQWHMRTCVLTHQACKNLCVRKYTVGFHDHAFMSFCLHKDLKLLTRR